MGDFELFAHSQPRKKVGKPFPKLLAGKLTGLVPEITRSQG